MAYKLKRKFSDFSDAGKSWREKNNYVGNSRVKKAKLTSL